MSYYDFNTAELQGNFELIPAGTIAKVGMKIKPGGYNDPDQGWTLDYATRSQISDAVYLTCEFTILEGEYARRRIWSNIGLYSEKNNNRWGETGRAFIRSILNSAKGFSNKDNSQAAQQVRKINSFADLDGIEFAAQIDVEIDQNDNCRNIIKQAIGPEHKDYGKVMQLIGTAKPGWA